MSISEFSILRMQKRVFQLLVDNTSGVLSRISGLFSRRGYNMITECQLVNLTL